MNERRLVPLIYAAAFVPFVGAWLTIFGTSVGYYALRGKQPELARAVNRNGWIAWALGTVFYAGVWYVLRR